MLLTDITYILTHQTIGYNFNIMATINGVDISIITSYNGKPLSSISVISGLQTSNIPGWPGQVECITLNLGFSDGRLSPPESSCTSPTQPYDFVNEVLFNFGTCGIEFAEPGYYSDGTTIFSWEQTPEGGWKWMVYSDCVVPGPVNNLAPSFTAVNTDTFQSIGSKGLWTTTGTVSYVYEWYSDDTLIFTQTSPLFNPKTGEWDEIEPFLNLSYSWLFTNITLKVICTDDTGTTSVTTGPEFYNDLTLDLFLLNSGVNSMSTINALQYLQKELRVNDLFDYYLIDYYPMVGSTENEIKWSLKNPNYFLNFSQGWTFSYYGAESSSTYNGVGTWADSSFSFYPQEPVNFAYYTPNPIEENSIDVDMVVTNTDNNTIFSGLRLQTKTQSGNMVFTGPGGTQTATNPFTPTGLIGIVTYLPDTPPFYYQGFVQNNLLGSPGSVGGTYSYPYSIRIGGGVNGNSVFPPLLPNRKLYQFVLVGKSLGRKVSVLNTIITTFQQMLGRYW
jgi:hypothetical protein